MATTMLPAPRTATSFSYSPPAQPKAPIPNRMPISSDSQDTVIRYLSFQLQMYVSSYNIRNQLEKRDRSFYRETDTTTTQTKAKAANDSGDASKMQNVTIPIVMPQVESALSDLQEIFLTGYPIFGTVSTPENQDVATQMDTVIGENSIKAGWPLELLKTMRDGLKYDLGAVEVTWENKKIYAITSPDDKNITQGAATETMYAGNFMKQLNVYNIILDPRVSPEKNHTEGEVAGYSELISRIEMKKRMEDLPVLGTMNFKKAFESPTMTAGTSTDKTNAFYIPCINPDSLLPIAAMNQGVNWLQYMGLDSGSTTKSAAYQSSYEWTVLYVRLIPTDFKIVSRNPNHVQIWKFVVINRSVVIFAERQTNAHNFLPVIVCKPSADPMGYQAKSFAENVAPLQAAASSLFNSGLESQRRKVYDRIYYDPSRINKKDIDDVSSVARIAVKNNAFGKTIADAVHESPYRDDGVAEIINLSQQVAQFADIANGQNRVTQGQFQKGNKTRKEFDTVMGNAGGRTRMRALALEYSFFCPIKEIIKSNTLQFQPSVTLTNRDSSKKIDITPQQLRDADLSFTLSDGFLPSEKLVSSDLFPQIFQAAGAMPAIQIEYDLMGMFVYGMKLQGANWMGSFKRSPQDQAAQLSRMQQASAAGAPTQQGAAPPASPSQPA